MFTLYNLFLFLHILGAIFWIGGTAALGVLATVIARSADPKSVDQFVRSLRTVGPIVLAPSPIALVAFGLALVFDSSAWDFDQAWVSIGFAIFVLVFLFGAAFQSRAAIGARKAIEEGNPSRAIALLKRWAWGAGFIVALLVVAAADMVFKPGL